jgi:hypothetical protein
MAREIPVAQEHHCLGLDGIYILQGVSKGRRFGRYLRGAFHD